MREHFTSRWGLIISVVGIAVGTGNIWRFPRIVAANGGGSFLIPWVIFLFLWSIPLIMTELAMGKMTRYGTVGSFAVLVGKKFAWMGTFVGFVATAIMFYYSVVAGWCIRYFFLVATGQLLNSADHESTWNAFVDSVWQPILFHFVAISAGALIVKRGVVNGIERANRFLIPALLSLLIISCLRAITLPGAVNDLAYLFTPDFSTLLDYKIWLQALTQNAWDTGAGWGLILTYMDMDISRRSALLSVYLITLALGIPSALSIDFFLNQDWTWGIALMVSGAFMAIAIIKYGVHRFRREHINFPESDFRVGRWYGFLIRYAIPTQVIVLITWWFAQVIQAYAADWWNPFSAESVGTCLFQWTLVIPVIVAANRFIVRRTLRPDPK